MAIRYWKKLREEGAKHAADPRPPGENPWEDAERPRLSDLAADRPTTDDRSSQYNDWADRMRQKRQRLREQYEGQPAPSYWTTDALFEESRRVEDEEILDRPNPWRIKELFAVLDLRDDASPGEVGKAYHRLAKEHHPDRYVEADDETREFHADRMRSINAAYRTLKELQKD